MKWSVHQQNSNPISVPQNLLQTTETGKLLNGVSDQEDGNLWTIAIIINNTLNYKITIASASKFLGIEAWDTNAHERLMEILQKRKEKRKINDTARI